MKARRRLGGGAAAEGPGFDPARVKIMSTTQPAGEQVSGQLAAALSLSDGTVSHHLAQLRKAGLVISDRRGHLPSWYIPWEALQAAVPCSTELLRLIREP